MILNDARRQKLCARALRAGTRLTVHRALSISSRRCAGSALHLYSRSTVLELFLRPFGEKAAESIQMISKRLPESHLASRLQNSSKALYFTQIPMADAFSFLKRMLQKLSSSTELLLYKCRALQEQLVSAALLGSHL